MIKEVHNQKELIKAIKESKNGAIIIYHEDNIIADKKLLNKEIARLFEKHLKKQEKAKEDALFIRRLMTKP